MSKVKNVESKIGITPLESRVVIKKDEKTVKTAGGIFIPETASPKIDKGTVLAVGKLCDEVKVNDRIIFDKHSGTDIEIGGVSYTLLMEANILCII